MDPFHSTIAPPIRLDRGIFKIRRSETPRVSPDRNKLVSLPLQMVKTVFHRKRSEFIQQHAGLWAEHYYFFHPLLNFLHQQGEGGVKLDCVFTISDGEQTIMGAQGGPCLLVYSLGWNEALLAELARQVRIDVLPKNLLLSGSEDLVTQLLQKAGRGQEVVSARYVYECKTLVPPFSFAPGQAALAGIPDIEAISQLSHGFQTEEYGDRFEHDLEYMRSHVVIPGIYNENIVKWIDRNRIVSMAQVMFTDEATGEDKPEIGHFYTSPDQRGKGYGASLVWHLTKTLLNDYGRCGLVAKQENPVSNAIFKKVGYELRYCWLKVLVQ